MLSLIPTALSFATTLAAKSVVLERSEHHFVSASKAATNLTYVKNSGICETTPGVEQISGYVEVASGANMVSSNQPVSFLVWTGRCPKDMATWR